MSLLKRLKQKLASKVVARTVPLDCGAASIIQRELFLFRSINGVNVDELSVPKFILDKFNVECDQSKCPRNKLAGIMLTESENDLFGYSKNTKSDSFI